MNFTDKPTKDWDLHDYISALMYMDWSYDFSDDHYFWQRGVNALGRLKAAQKRLDPDYKVWNEHCNPKCKNGVAYA